MNVVFAPSKKESSVYNHGHNVTVYFISYISCRYIYFISGDLFNDVIEVNIAPNYLFYKQASRTETLMEQKLIYSSLLTGF